MRPKDKDLFNKREINSFKPIPMILDTQRVNLERSNLKLIEKFKWQRKYNSFKRINKEMNYMLN